MLLALTIAAQTFLRMIIAPPYNQFIIGSFVNFFIIASVIICGFSSAFVISTLATVIAFLMQQIAFVQIVPIVALGNIAIAAVYFLSQKLLKNKPHAALAIAVIPGAAAKFLILWLGVTKIFIPFFLPPSAPPAAAAMMTFNFSWPQLLTAYIGGIIAVYTYHFLKKIK